MATFPQSVLKGLTQLVDAADDKFAIASVLIQVAHKAINDAPPSPEKTHAAPYLNVAASYFPKIEAEPEPTPVADETPSEPAAKKQK